MNPADKSDKLLKIIVILGVLLVLFFGLRFVFGNKSENTTVSLAKIAARQEELIRLAEEADKFSDGFTVSKVTTEAQILLRSSLNDLTKDYAIAKLEKEQLAEFTVSGSKDTLESASKEDRFTEEFVALYGEQLNKQQAAIQDLYKSTSNAQLKASLEKASEYLNTISEQLEKL